MKPYYEDDLVTLYLGNCLEVREWLTADVVITDPPYGVGGELSISKPSKGNIPVHGKQDWDDDLVVRNAALALWGTRPSAVFASPKKAFDPPSEYRGLPLIWDKGIGVGMGDGQFPWRPNYELIYVAGPGWHGHRDSSILRHNMWSGSAREEGHPTPKPVPLMAELVRKAPPGVIADPFAGSGTTLRAAKDHGRKAIGVELSERYCEVAANRLSQDTLFSIDAPVPIGPAEDASFSLPVICPECGNDEVCEGLPYCSDCIEVLQP